MSKGFREFGPLERQTARVSLRLTDFCHRVRGVCGSSLLRGPVQETQTIHNRGTQQMSNTPNEEVQAALNTMTREVLTNLSMNLLKDVSRKRPEITSGRQLFLEALE